MKGPKCPTDTSALDTSALVPNCLRSEVSWVRSVRTPVAPAAANTICICGLGLELRLGLGLGLRNWPNAQCVWSNAQVDSMRLTITAPETEIYSTVRLMLNFVAALLAALIETMATVLNTVTS